MEAQEIITAVGRRKTASARVRLTRGTGKLLVNQREVDAYFTTEQAQRIATSPLVTAEMQNQFDITIRVEGGGQTGQAGAVSLGIARALQKFDAEKRPVLKKAGLLKRDPRAKERKKSGQPGARKHFQFSKR